MYLSFTWHRDLLKEMKMKKVFVFYLFFSKKCLNLRVLGLSLMKNGEAWKDVIGCTRVWAKDGNLGETAIPVDSRFFENPSIFGDKDASFLCFENREDTSYMRILWPASGEGRKIYPVPALSQIRSAWSIHCAKVPYFGVACCELHQKWDIKL